MGRSITVGELKEKLAAMPDDSFEICISTPEMDADDFDVELTVLEGPTSDGPGHIMMIVKEA
jgi:hypothetical protein